MLQILKELAVKTPAGAWLQDRRWLADVERYRSRLPRDEARKYDDYIENCRRLAPVAVGDTPALTEVVRSWERDGYATFCDPSIVEIAKAIDAGLTQKSAAGAIWSDQDVYVGDAYLDFPEFSRLFAPGAPLARAIEAAFRTHFKIFYCKIYRSLRRAEAPTGSQLWHADGGPGTCLILMFAISELSAANGAMKLVVWPKTLGIFAKEREHLRRTAGVTKDIRDRLCAFYGEEIAQLSPASIRQPIGGPGTALFFMNNLIHQGGFPPSRDVERRVAVFHVYPSDQPAPLELYARFGLDKQYSYPLDPAF